jgi:tetratricopeptide (TPR) repeat protein
MLETIREYALARLEEREDAESLRRLHAEWFLALAEEAEPQLRSGVKQADWHVRIELELENFRAALRWADDVGDSGCLLRLSGGLSRFWALHGAPDGLRWLEKAVAETSGEVSAPRVVALIGAASIASSRRRDAHAISLAKGAVALARELGDEALTARALVALGLCLEDTDSQLAQELYDEGRELFRSAGDEWGLGVATLNLATGALGRGDLPDAARLLGESLEIARATDDEEGQALTLASLGFTHLEQGKVESARSAFGDSLRIASRLALPTLIAENLVGAAALAIQRGDSTTAASLVTAADVLLETFGVSFWASERKLRERTLATARAALGADEFAASIAAARLWTGEEAVARAYDQLQIDARQA